MLALEVKERSAKESAATLRARGAVPAVFYGPKEASTPISIDALKLQSIWKQAGETTIITLKGLGEEKSTLIHDVQFHPVTGALLHADFYVLEKGKKVHIKVPLEFVGAAPAEKMGHIVVKTLHEVEIEVAPQELPHNLPVDISALENVGDHVLVSQIKLPPSAALVTHGEEIVVSVKEFKEEPVEITPAPETIIEGAEPAAEGAAPAEAPAAEEKKEKSEKKGE
jgi:large subunit ribosomal protein L25